MTVNANFNVADKEKQAYIDHVREKEGSNFKYVYEIDLVLHPMLGTEFVDITWKKRTPAFDRIRRITGYLVGTLDRFNDGKKAEVMERVKHNLKEDD